MKTYYFQYTTCEKAETQEQAFSAYSPVDALDRLHKFMQTPGKFDPVTHEARVPCAPSDYKICRLFLRYQDDSGLEIESEYALPPCANPDVRETED